MSLLPIYAFDIDTEGSAAAVEDINAPIPDSAAYRWLHFDLNSTGLRDWIEQRVDAVTATSLTRQDTRPSLSPMDNGSIIILRGVNLNPESDPEDMVSVRLWVSERLIISTRLRKLMAITAIREQIESGHPPRSPGEFITRLANGLTERMDPVVAELSDRIDALEEESVDRAAGLRSALADIRRTVIALRRYVAPQRDVLYRLASDGFGLFDRKIQLRLRETSEQVTRLVEELDAVRERCGILNDQLVDKRAEEMNTNMMVLSVVAAIFLPLGFLTGLLGINVGGMPGANFAWAFYIVCALCVAIGLGLTWYFRAKKWF
ncbi:zinc transporter ZntB [Hyphobacterium sp.]|uniref:zinc transporter ZntB n=1 Tax=Hyphobacterium sp. TaxID=2004662 RepID=UPI003BABB145